MEQGEIIEVIISAIPYSDQIKDINVTDKGSVRFNWRGTRYRVSNTLHVEEVENGCLVGSDKAILMRKILEMVRILKDL